MYSITLLFRLYCADIPGGVAKLGCVIVKSVGTGSELKSSVVLGSVLKTSVVTGDVGDSFNGV